MNGITFASIKEAKRYTDLYYLEKAGEISALQLQVPFPIVINSQKVCTYVADFVYLTKKGDRVIEDAKGFRTGIFKLKAKLLLAMYGVTIKEI
ncbi:DUF1064 domain-containing protein [Foetidibacter luteolus]|uniref:DUF1064 domain-containing protein n=1 Tax=Foetidibacter luteolus TaxID=2608880 RepID=UPI001A983405|nr:DUF1064 domain-containing protein [Foetidibacter luteolus]